MLRLTNLRCEYLSEPIGIDTMFPRFSWNPEHPERGQRQSAYHILVASSQDLLRANTGDLWDSGKVLSDQSVNVLYAKPRCPEKRHNIFLKVRAWDGHELQERVQFDIHLLEMGLLRAEEWQGEWITRTDEGSPLFFVRSLPCKSLSNERDYIFPAWVITKPASMGAKSENMHLIRGWTDYEKHDFVCQL